jgi:hypothetical protein
MASSFQQQSLQRKLIYIALIVVLFTASWLFRRSVVEAQAEDLALREQSLGDVELTGSAVRLSLTGLRGLTVCILWNNAIEKQKKNQWDELELLVNSVTKLQPHFITPWLFQSWNLSYNVAVKCDLNRDKYFYIARGLELLAEGERQNRHQPDLRFHMGTYYQSKICIADQKVALQSLFQLSSITPSERSEERLYRADSQGRKVLDMKEFEQFCQANPRLVRRLHDQLKLRSPEQVAQFLVDNAQVPSLFEKTSEGGWKLKDTRTKRFPFLPPPRQGAYDPNELTYESSLGDDFDAFAAARAWYGYAQEPLPPPDDKKPGHPSPITDRSKQRLPRNITACIFRGYPSRAQCYVAERLQEEGWFDEGWKVVGWFPEDKFSDGQSAIVGDPRRWTAQAWNEAHQRYYRFGEANLLLLTREKKDVLEGLAKKLIEKLRLQPGQLPPELPPELREQKEWVEAWEAYDFLHWYQFYRGLTNFPHFYACSEAEAKPDTVASRKALFRVNQELKSGRLAVLKEEYDRVLEQWRKVLDANPAFRGDSDIQTSSYEMQYNYLKEWLRSPYGTPSKQAMLAEAALTRLTLDSAGADAWLALAQAVRPAVVADPLVEGILDGKNARGDRYITPEQRDQFRMSKGVIRPKTAGEGAGAVEPDAPPPPPRRSQ